MQTGFSITPWLVCECVALQVIAPICTVRKQKVLWYRDNDFRQLTLITSDSGRSNQTRLHLISSLLLSVTLLCLSTLRPKQWDRKNMKQYFILLLEGLSTSHMVSELKDLSAHLRIKTQGMTTIKCDRQKSLCPYVRWKAWSRRQSFFHFHYIWILSVSHTLIQ